MDAATCANCESPLTGPYCSQCGQHAHESSRSVGALFDEAWHVVTHVDGRFWRTIGALLRHPGRLTCEYFADRRARYLPPVRLYLVLSLLFFAIAATGPHLNYTYVQTPQGWRYAMVPGDPDNPHNEGGTTIANNADITRARGDVLAAIKEAQTSGATVIASDADAGLEKKSLNCDSWRSDWKPLGESLRDVCRRNVGDNFQGLLGAFVASIPKMMFLFLPLMAFAMMLMYWRPRRHYVDHLVFFIHTHAAIFFVLLVEVVLSRLARVVPPLAHVTGYVNDIGFVYVIWYVFRAMRIFYGQGRWLTLAKMTVIGVSYAVSLFVTLALTFVVVALLA